jgi:hypothetical protein
VISCCGRAIVLTRRDERPEVADVFVVLAVVLYVYWTKAPICHHQTLQQSRRRMILRSKLESEGTVWSGATTAFPSLSRCSWWTKLCDEEMKRGLGIRTAEETRGGMARNNNNNGATVLRRLMIGSFLARLGFFHPDHGALKIVGLAQSKNKTQADRSFPSAATANAFPSAATANATATATTDPSTPPPPPCLNYAWSMAISSSRSSMLLRILSRMAISSAPQKK